ncbi:uncharacterized protein [Chelonus insularis]|uniref:uncharacterized protein n=1 Tax=Chelonus insularis TaxID=460826 RepID=UPI00158E1257|nr:uncharacterized protein LOC118072543 [Chelonus insularis]
MVVMTDINVSEFIESHEWAKKLSLTHVDEIKYFLNSDPALSLSHILLFALKSFKSSPSTIDLIHRNVLDFISDHYEIKIQVLNYFLQHLDDTILDVSNEINGINLLKYHHQIIDEILSQKHLNACSYDCLTEFVKYNPLIIEEKLPKIFKKILRTKKETQEEQASYVLLLSEILYGCNRIKREIKLIPWILMAVDKNSKKKNFCDQIDDVLPEELLNRFTTVVSSMTNAQIIKLLISFIYHLKLIESKESNPLISIQIMSKLIVAFFDGVHLFDNSTLNMQQKFVNCLTKFGHVLENLNISTASIDSREIFMVSFLKIINSWEAMVALIKKYAPDAFTEDSMSSMTKSVQSIHEIIDRQNLNQCGDQNLMKCYVSCKLEERRIHDNPPLVENDIEILKNIDTYWEILFDKYPYLILHFNELQIESLANLLITNTQFDQNNILDSTYITHVSVQNNEKLVNELIYFILCNISLKLNDSSTMTKKLLKIMVKKKWEDKRLDKIFESCKELLSNEIEWIQINDESMTVITQYLQILLVLPLIYINIKLKTFIFLIIFTIGKESEKSKEIGQLCLQILSDISENGKIDILQYISSENLISELPKYPPIIKHLQCSLKNVSNYQKVATFIKNNKNIEHCAAPILIDCIENIKPRLKVNEKRIARKLEKKLSKRILKALQSGVKTPYEVKCLTAAIKVAVVSEQVDESLVEKINSTLDTIFNVCKNEPQDININPLVEEGLKLIEVVLLHQSQIPIDKKIGKGIWRLMLKNVSENIIKNLFSITSPKLLKKILTLLKKQIILAHRKQDDPLLTNSLQIWCSIAYAQIGIRSNMIRHSYLQAFLRYFSTSTISHDHYLTVLKICEFSIRAKKSQFPEKTIDLVLLILNDFINDPSKLTVTLCEGILEVCSVFVRFRASIITERLPALLYVYRKVLKFIVDESRKCPTVKQRELECCCLNAQKLTSILVKSKKDIARISAYTIADLIEIYADGVVPVYIKEPLTECINMFFSICDQHAISLLLRALPISMQEICKTLYSTYTKFYKFTGKI